MFLLMESHFSFTGDMKCFYFLYQFGMLLYLDYTPELVYLFAFVCLWFETRSCHIVQAPLNLLCSLAGLELAAILRA